MSKIEGSAHEALAHVQGIVEQHVPDARCELQDYQHRIGCGAPNKDGEIVDVVMLRRGLDEAQVTARAQELARKVAIGKDEETQEWLDSMKPLTNKNRVV